MFDLNANLASILTLIGVLTTSIISVITAIKVSNTKIQQGEKLDRIEGQTNGTLNKLKAENEALKAENQRLDIVNSRLTGDRRRRPTRKKSKPKKNNSNGGASK